MKKVIKKYKIFIVLFFCVVTTIILIVNTIRIQSSNQTDGNTINTGGLKSNGIYDIPHNPTKYQIDLYNELSELLKGYEYKGDDHSYHDSNSQEKAICESVVKNFVSDYFTWSNKASSYDVGGMGFVGQYSAAIYRAARDTYYADLDGFIAQYGRNNLPIVKDVVVSSVYGGDYYYFITNVPSFYCEANWNYESGEKDLTGFPTSAWFKIVWDFNKQAWLIAEIGEPYE